MNSFIDHIWHKLIRPEETKLILWTLHTIKTNSATSTTWQKISATHMFNKIIRLTSLNPKPIMEQWYNIYKQPILLIGSVINPKKNSRINKT